MAVKQLLFLAFLTQVSCEERTVTFVVDDTFSLVDGIKQIKNASQLILDMVLEKSEIEDYVLVTFNDPDTELKKKTRDRKEFVKALNSIKVHGGNIAECSKIVLTGVRRALTESRDGSYVFVFADASARDYDQFEEVKALCRKKKSQIYFIVTGHCGDISTRRYQVYHNLAAACNGQAITIHRNDVAQVPAYLKEIIESNKTLIESAVIPANRWKNIKFSIDDLTENSIISASGVDVDLAITNARNTPVRRGKKIVWTRNFKAFIPSKLRNGVYTAKVRGKSPVDVTIMARTNFRFEYGFSVENVTTLNVTDPRPFTDIKTRLLIFAKDPEGSAEVREVELHSVTGKVSKLLNQVMDNVYATEEYLSPNQPFKIAVVATAKKTKKTVKSFAKTLVVPITPTSVEQIKVKEGASIDISCRIPISKKETQIKWYERQKEGYFNVLNGETKEVLHIKKPVDKVYYKCLARKATTGYDQYNGQIDIQVRPEFFYPPSVVTTNIGNTVTIKCKIFKGNPRPDITWQFKHVNATTYKPMAEQGDILNIKAAELEHSGDYRCFANSTEGTDEKITKLLVQETPEILKTDDHFTIKEGASIDLKCSILKGIPKPIITWYSKQEAAIDFKEIVNERNEILHVINAQVSKSYKCEANNSDESDFYIVKVDVEARPEFRITTPNISVNEGGSVIIDCRLRKGSQPLERSWEQKPKGTASFKIMKHEGEQLIIPAAEQSHAGEYRCVAENPEGHAEKITELIVRVAPVIENVAPNKTALENSNVALQCRVTKGFPKPTINWFYKIPGVTEFFNMLNNDEVLLLENIKVSYAGQYKCVVENEVGLAEQTVQLVVNAPPRVLLSTSKHTAVKGDPSLRLPCAAAGHPTPNITWLVDGKIVGLGKYEPIYVENNVLIIQNPKEAYSSRYHTYVCRANNEVGEDSQTYEVVITDHIEFSKINEIYYGIYNEPYDIKCPLLYSDPSSLKWYKNSKLIADKTGPSLHLDNPTELVNGNYTCRVSGLTDSPTHTAQVIFGLPPTREETFYNVEWRKDEKSINCYSSEYPEGKYEWFFNGKKIGWNKETINITRWGEYICNVINPLGSLDIIYKVTTPEKECRIPKSIFTSEHAPLVLDSSLSWPILQTVREHFLVPHSEKLQLICQDDSNSPSKNSFTTFPNLKSLYATCEEEDLFLVDGDIRKISEFECKQNVIIGVKQTKIPCLGESTELMQVGVSVDGFTEVYQSCMDLNKLVPLYTKINTIPAERTLQVVDDKARKESCVDESECCYESIQLVNAIDVSFGPAKSATMYDTLNSVNYCKLKNDFDWTNIEMISRSEIPYTVWTGASRYEKVNKDEKKINTPRYLWKVLRYNSGSDEEIIAIIHENVNNPGPRLCTGVCGKKTILFEPSGHRTYCCGLEDFKKALGVDINLKL